MFSRGVEINIDVKRVNKIDNITAHSQLTFTSSNSTI